MRSRYDEREANEFVRRYADRAAADLALRVYTSRLIGADAELVLHGGGNTSVKGVGLEVTGEECEVLLVKGSGWDLQSIEPEGFPACRLHPLRRMCALPELSDEQMVQGLRSQMLNPASPTPSVEALLHAFLPARFVDHTHANAVLAVVDQRDGERRAHEVWKDGLLFVPYIMPGFVLARRVVELWSTVASPSLIVLEKHGILTWGPSALESYERMLEAVSAAESYVGAARISAAVPEAAAALSDEQRKARQRRLSPLLRGALARGPDAQRVVLQWRDEPAILQLLARADAEQVTQIGPITPDHVIRTKPWPLWLGDLSPRLAGESEDGETRGLVEGALAAFSRHYEAYFDGFSREDSRPLTRLDRRPRLALVPELGAVALGSSVAEAQITGDLYAHTARVILDALAVGGYRPVNERELFEVEYWTLEQAKLKLAQKAPRPLDGQIAIVTGAASGIGLATARHLLELGAHVVASDRDGARLQAALASHAARVATCTTDVRDETDVAALFEFTLQRFGGLDIVVSNAGTAPSGWLHEPAGHAALLASLEINLLAHQHVARAAAGVFVRQGIGGCLLFNASKSAFNPGPEFGPYAVAKAALLALMRQYAVDLGSHAVRSNAVNADRVRTELFGGGVLEARARARGIDPQHYFEQNLLGRETRAEDVAHAFGWLARAEATTGAVITVDGGNPAAFPR
jgi:rhamnose utilization protein RhaD (predicted bifunctional aldolase and dehydrogenase)/NAD(P)-dependent dehydrogenase (short-subunit alcohol dehydrogenase family)